MPTTNISSVGTGKDYATWTLWEAATDNDLVTQDRIEVGEGYTETLTESVAVSGATTDTTRYRIMRANSAHEHDGVYGTGHQIQVGGGVITIAEAYCVVRDLTIRASSSGTYILNTTALAYIERCFVVGDIPGFTGTYPISMDAGGHVRSCVVVGLNRGISLFGSVASEVSNCTVIGRSDLINTAVPQDGIQNFGTGVVTSKNNCVLNFNQDFKGTLTASNNASSDGSASGAGSITGQIVSTLRFRAAAALDYVPKSDSTLVGAGTDLSANFNYDIAGNTMPAAWPIGAYAPCQAPTFAGASSAADNTDGSVLVSWAAATAVVSAIRGYKVHVHTAAMVDADLDADTYLLSEVPVGRTSLDVWTLGNGVTALTAGTTYYFSVRAISESGDEDQNVVNKSAAPTEATAPTAAINGSIGSITSTGFVMTLDAVPASNIDRWRVGYRIKNDETTSVWTYSTASTTLTIGTTITVSGLTANRVYEVVLQGGNGLSTWGDVGEWFLIYTRSSENTWDGTQITNQIMTLIDDNLTSQLSLTRKTQYGSLQDYPSVGRDMSSHLPLCMVELENVTSRYAQFPNVFDLVYTYRIIHAAEYATSDAVMQNRVNAVGALHGLFTTFRQLGLAGGATTEGKVGWLRVTNIQPRPPEDVFRRHDNIYVVALTLEVNTRANA